jgi:phage protein D
MMGFFNQQSAFFEVKAKSLPASSVMNALQDRIISLSVTEERKKIFTGSIRMYDPFNTVLDMMLRPGIEIELSWGYKFPDSSLIAKFAQMKNPKEIIGAPFRGGVKARIIGPSGGGDQNGVVTYNANFMGNAFFAGKRSRVWTSTTKSQIVHDVLTDLDISPANRLVSFQNGNDKIGMDGQVVQIESHFRFLKRFAQENDCEFSIGHGKMGSVALFSELSSQDAKRFASMVGGSVGDSITLNYKHGTANVESYTFEHNAGNEQGDNVQISFVNKEPQFKRYRAEEQTITDYRINMPKIRAEIESKAARSAGSAVAHAMSLLQENSFDALVEKGYFIAAQQSVAPQGYGWSLKVRMLGNPMMTAPTKVILGEGFPNIFRPQTGVMPKQEMWVRSVTHVIDEHGYHMDLDIVDALTLQGGSYVA